MVRTRKSTRIASALALLGMLASTALAASPDGYTRKLWQTQDGLPEQTVQAFAQTPDHYLWIGTTGGLLRFDGAHFTVFDHGNTPQLHENSVFALLVSRDGSLWIGTEGGGLARWQNGKFRSYGAQDGLSDGFVRALFEDRGGTMWIGTDNGLLRFAAGRLVRVDGTGNIPPLAVHAIAEDHSGGLWVGGSRLLRLDHGMAREFTLQGGGSQNRVKSILETRDGTLWVGTVSGLHRLRPGAQRFERVQGITQTVRVLRQLSDGSLWVGTIGEGIRRIVGDSVTAITAPDSLPSNTVLNVFQDDEQNLWIGTQAGMLRLTRTPVRIVPLPQAADSDFGTLYADRDGTLWVVSTDVFQVRNGLAVPWAHPQLGPLHARNIFRDRAGALWIGTDGDGLIRVDNGNVLRLTARDGLVNNFIRVIVQSHDSSMWFGTDEGVSHWTSRGFVNYQMRDGLSYFSTRALIEDRNGDIWIGTDRGLNHLHAGVFVHDAPTAALAEEKVWSIHEDSDGGLWFGTRSNGLYRWRDDQLTHYTTAQGLASNSIYQIVEDRKGGLWLSGPNGISLLQRRELDEAADHPAQHLSLTLYGVSDEVETTQIYGGRQPSGCVDGADGVWFPSNKGPIHIARETAPPLPLPQVVIDEVSIDGRSVDPAQPIMLAPGATRLEISWSPILLRSQEGMRFRYRLGGFDNDWSAASPRRTASWTNLPPGTYSFHVAAFEINRPEAVSEIVLPVVQRPHFWRTWWFVGCCVLLLAAAFLGAYRFRLWQMRMRFEGVLDERARLAREMHDTVIQGCAGISALLEALASLREEETSLPHELLDHARRQVRTTIDEARQAVWNLRQGQPSGRDLEATLESMARQISAESGIPVVCEISGKPFSLTQMATHELMMMAREAVYNAVLHAHPDRVDVRVVFDRNELMLEVRDNGSGFEPAAVFARQDRHYGLVGMRERIEAVGGDFHLDSAPGRGTDLTVRIPRRIYGARSAMMGV
ncbi:MAG TPA: two-component regulator propeller domain-containing protein [Acidobacteriaceae bacterium]|nr:two-component regulator propeller domain-containing protein [Acidobacteriaceae bacterium]